jgi:hypothetical protein
VNERIDHSNYEAWLLDRLEGDLSPEQERMLDAFLAANPGLDDERKELPTLDRLDAQLAQADKDALKRHLPPTGMPAEPIDDFLIARLEGDLDPRQEEALRLYLQDHPEHQRAERIYALTKLVPLAMTYVGKRTLERQLPPLGEPTSHTLDDFLVARLEGGLDPAQELSLSAYLAVHPDAQRQWRLMELARVPANTVVYPAKSDLKKGGKVIAIGATKASWVVRLRVAATVAVLLGLAIWTMVRTPDNAPQLVIEQQEAPSPMHSTGDATDDTATGPAAQENAVEERTTTPPSVPVLPTQEHLANAPAAQRNATPAGERHTVIDPLDQAPDEQLAQERPVVPVEEQSRPGSERQIPEAEGIAPNAAGGTDDMADAAREGVRLGSFLTGKLRQRVLAGEEADQRPLDKDDLVAAVDKGLKTVGGEDAALVVERTDAGRYNGFHLRLGRNLAITAGR